MISTYVFGEKRKTMVSSIFNGLKINSEFQDLSPLKAGDDLEFLCFVVFY